MTRTVLNVTANKTNTMTNRTQPTILYGYKLANLKTYNALSEAEKWKGFSRRRIATYIFVNKQHTAVPSLYLKTIAPPTSVKLARAVKDVITIRTGMHCGILSRARSNTIKKKKSFGSPPLPKKLYTSKITSLIVYHNYHLVDYIIVTSCIFM